MPDEQKVKTASKIQKWTGWATTAIVLIGAVYLQAPWKITVYLLVCLLGGILFPKPVKKWLPRAILVIVAVLIIWVFLPESNNWRPYTFDKELAAIEAERAIPDEENAALFYTLLLENYDKKNFESNLSDPNVYSLSLSCLWSSEEYPEMAEWLKSQQDTIDILTLACQKQKCRFPINADILSPPDLESQSYAMKNWGLLLIRLANNQLAEGYTEKAIKTYTDAIQMAQHQYQQSTAIDFLIGRGVACRTTDRFISFIVTANATEESLNGIEIAITKITYDRQVDLTNIFNHEKLLLKNFWSRVFYETNEQGNVRRIYNAPEKLHSHSKLALERTYWQKRIHRAKAIFCWIVLPSNPKSLSRAIDSIYEKYYQMTESTFNWKQDPKQFSSKPKYRLNYRILIEVTAAILEKSYYNINDIYLKTITQQRGCRLIIAMKQYKNKAGYWPESLDEIKDLAPAEVFVDLLNNGTFVYKLTEENFTLYSKGKNDIDENGKNEKLYGGTQGEDDWPIWPEPKHK